jgi:PPOX class probable F420-dependent enzyme
MDIAAAREFLRTNHHAVLGTYHADGRIQMSPVTVAVDGEGRVLVSTRETAVKTRNLRRDPRAVLCVLPDQFYGEWALIEGDAELVALPEALDLLVDYYRLVGGEHPDWDDYRAAMVREQRVLVRVTIAKAGPSYQG